MTTPTIPAPPWLSAEMAALGGARESGRVPHALLIHEAPGAGGDWLAAWAAQLVLCTKGGATPCGECPGCRRAAALQHPDLAWVRPLEESRQIRIEQVRELSADLALTSHAGGYKVGILTPADALNRFAANALLKTLEEPAPRTVLILVATQPSRLPPTILSRCQRLRVRAPERAAAVAWLNAARGKADWDAALEVLGEAPFLALNADPSQLADIGADTRSTLDALLTGTTDPVGAAERWARSDLPLRLLCFEIWLTEHIRGGGPTGGFLTEMRAAPYLSGGGPFLNIREQFGMLDEVRDLRATLDAPLNRGLALEALFRRLAPASRARSGGRG
ncbi:MAG TPA: DNA polymerase III subunit delta' [Steroidobacteraceae bacterium]|nr:DNA polymerase III subunit delta' [Steroidobacteraceae bacterium]